MTADHLPKDDVRWLNVLHYSVSIRSVGTPYITVINLSFHFKPPKMSKVPKLLTSRPVNVS